MGLEFADLHSRLPVFQHAEARAMFARDARQTLMRLEGARLSPLIAHGHAVTRVVDPIDSITADCDGTPILELMPVTPYASMGDPRRES